MNSPCSRYALAALCAAGLSAFSGSALAQAGSDACSLAAPAISLGVPVSSSTTNATTTDFSITPAYTCGIFTGSGGGRDVFYTFTPPGSGVSSYEVSLCGSAFDTTVAVMTACSGAAANVVACNDDAAPTCGSLGQSRITSVGLTGGVTYLVRVAGYGTTNSGAFTLAVNSTGPAPANDYCSLGNALPQIPGAGGTVSGTCELANQDGETSCSDISGVDVWYRFTPSGTGPWRVSLCSTAVEWDTVLSVHTACPNSSSYNQVAGGCRDDGCTAGNFNLSQISSVALTAGTQYLIRVAGWEPDAAATAFTLSVTNLGGTPPPANDSCLTPTVINPAALPATLVGDSVAATESPADNGIVSASCSFNATDDRDVWFSFTPAQAGLYGFDTIDSAGVDDTVLSIYSGPCAGLSEVACNDDINIFDLYSQLSVALNGGETYLVRVVALGGGGGEFNLNVTPPIQAPTNDDCENAENITALPFFSGTVAIGGAQPDIDVSCNSSAAGATNNGVWYTYTPATSCTASFNQEGADAVTAVFTGTCSGLTQIACSDPPTSAVPLVGGTTYLILVGYYFSDPAAANATITLSVDCGAAPPAPANDTCAGGTIISALPFSSGPIEVGGATDDIGATCADNIATTRAGVWFTYAPLSNCVMQMTQANDDIDSITVVYSGDCSGLTELACSDPETSTFGAVGGTTYHILVGRWSDSGPALTDTYTFNLDCVPAAANDECSAAIGLTVGTPLTGTLGVASNSIDTSCSGTDQDVWYAFTAISGRGYEVVFTPDSAADDSAAVALFTACPPTSADEVACNGQQIPGDPNTVIHQATSGGTTYIRVGTFAGDAGAFTIVVNELMLPPVPANDTCAGATVISAVPYDSGPVRTFAASDDSNVDPSCDEGALPVHRGVWWTYTPSADATLVVSDTGGYDTAISIWTGSDCNALVEISCADDESSLFAFTGGTTYYILDSFWLSRDGGGTPPIDSEYRFRLAPVALNDACENAIVPVLPYVQHTNTTSTTSDGPQIAAGPLCNSELAQAQGLNFSIWYRVTAPSSGTLRIQAHNIYDTLINVYSGTECAALTFVNDDSCAGDGDNFAIDGYDNTDYSLTLAAGATRYIAIGSFGSTAVALPGSGDLTLTFTPDGPVSEFCCRGTTCASVSAGTCTGTIAGSSSQVIASCGSGNSSASCCFADYNHTGGTTIDDLFLYLNAYFTSSPYANFGGDTVANPTIDDLFLYINAYFTGCQP